MRLFMKTKVALKNAIIFIFIGVFCTLTCSISYAKSIHRPPVQLLMTHKGEILHSQNAKKIMYPASLTKLMTIYIAFEALKAKKIDFNKLLRISEKAAAMPRSNINLAAGDTITLREAILSLIIRSANDSAVAIAENLAGSESNFAKKMNLRAQQLGMSHTHFVNASGWHHSNQKTTAYDMAKLAIALKRDFPSYYYLFSKNSFFYRSVLYQSHNHVNVALKGAEGLKTGFTNPAGWNIVTAARRGNKRLVGVILGSGSRRNRDITMIKMMNTHFAQYEISPKKNLYTSNNTIRTKKADLDKHLILRKIA